MSNRFAHCSQFLFIASRCPHLIVPPFLMQLTVADIAIANIVRTLRTGNFDGIPTTIVDAYPKMVALTDSVMGEPKIAEFRAHIAASK